MLAADDPVIRQQLTAALEGNGYLVDELLPTRRIVTLPALYEPLVINTGSDVAALCQAVYHIRENETNAAMPVIAIVDQDTAARNPTLWGWDINGEAAVAAVVIFDERTPGEIVRFLNRCVTR